MDDLEARIDELYASPPDGFTASRDALAKELKAAGDDEDAKRVKALRKPVVPAAAVNRLAHDDPDAIAEVLALGTRLRAEQRRAISGGDVDALREALDERRRLVRDLTKRAMAILRKAGSGTAAQEEEITATLEAAAADEDSGEAVRAGRLEKPLRPPTGFGDGGGLRVLEGGRSKRKAAPSPAAEPSPKARAVSERERAAADRARERERREERRALEREIARTEKAERAAAEAVERARERLERADAERADAKDAARSAESDLRGATLERKRAAAALERAD
jgi:hypothetical protein